MNASQAFLLHLRDVCSELWGSQSQNLALLLSTGESKGTYAWKLFREYKSWGLLHLLVLSGSQYYSFSNAWLAIIQSLQKFFYKESFPLFARLSLFPITFFYLNALDFPAPLVRCALLSLFLLVLSPLKIQKTPIVILVFIFHMIVENFHPSDSAFLSWVAYLTLQVANLSTQSPILRTLIVTSTLHLFISAFKGVPFSNRSFIIAALSNLIYLPIYEKLLFPCIGFISAFCVLISPLGAIGLSSEYFRDFISTPLAFILDLALLPVLVANSTFRYTFSE